MFEYLQIWIEFKKGAMLLASKGCDAVRVKSGRSTRISFRNITYDP